jgi:hypothetical protein
LVSKAKELTSVNGECQLRGYGAHVIIWESCAIKMEFIAIFKDTQIRGVPTPGFYIM